MESTAASTNSSFAMDLLLVFPRLAQRAGVAAFHPLEAMDSIAGQLWKGGSMIADATGQQIANNTITNTSTALAQSTAIANEALQQAFVQSQQTWREGGDEVTSTVFSSILQGFNRLKNFGGIFSYLTSRWALATFTIALVLNRTQFYASSRVHLHLQWWLRLAIYGVPIAAFFVQLHTILQALRCQTSPDFPHLRYGDPLKKLAIDFGAEGGMLYWLSSSLLYWETDRSCCDAQHFSLDSVTGDRSELRGSMSLLFRFFLVLCTSQFFDTFASTLQGKQPMPETGMTIFEHSLAFAECEAMISSALGLGFFGTPKLSGSTGSQSSGPLVSRSEIMQRLNVPPEVLLVCLISSLSHLSSATLAVLGIRHRVRLVNTGIWACSYMAFFTYTFFKLFHEAVEHVTDLGVLRFPTVCMVGFVPHFLILVGIVVCGTIYGLALLTTALGMPSDSGTGMSFRRRLGWAYKNLQSNVQFSSASSIRIKMSEDFYSMLLKVGFSLLTAASEAVYLNEGSHIQVPGSTWADRQRIDEMANRLELRKRPSIPSALLGDDIARGVSFSDHQNAAVSPSPYARERRSQPKAPLPGSEQSQQGEMDTGLGIAQRRTRAQMTMDFFAGVLGLLTNINAQFIIGMLNRLGIERRPTWLLKAAGIRPGQQKSSSPFESNMTRNQRDFWMLGPGGRMMIAPNDDVDVEIETRRILQRVGNYHGEESLADQVYSWWRRGGWFGNLDDSGDYEDNDVDDDVTSMISMSTNASVDDDENGEDDDSGARTPTQQDPFSDRSREATPAVDGSLDMGMLTRLLNPHSADERDEARLLSYSLQSSRPMTRSQYRRQNDHSRSELLRRSGTIYASEDEELEDIEWFILEQRKKGQTKAPNASTWQSGGEGMGESGPQCVVCQSSPRTILVWPCGCLSMCDDCRVGLAARNYTKCICCRTDIAAYSRLYVP